MPISKYYGGHGEKVMHKMKKQYGDERGEKIFYATANKHGKRPHGSGTFSEKEVVQGYRRVG